MTLFTDSLYEKMMIQKPEDGKRDKSPPASFPPRCAGCPYRGQSPCIGYCIRKLENTNSKEYSSREMQRDMIE